MIYLFFVSLVSSSSVFAQTFCYELFSQNHWQKTLYKIEQLNQSETLSDVILVQDSPMTRLIRANRLGDLVLFINERKRLNQPRVFFDEINLAVALGHNNIARLLVNASTFPYARTPLREDFLKTAIYFDNLEMLSFFTFKKKYYFSTRKTNSIK